MTAAEKWLVLLLRFNALILISAFAVVVMPTAWMESIHEELGMGTLPRTPLMGYLTRSVSGLYGVIGIATWMLASDIRRYWPLITLWSVSCLLFGPVLMVIDWSSGMPGFWIYFEGPYLFLLGILLSRLQSAVVKHGDSDP